MRGIWDEGSKAGRELATGKDIAIAGVLNSVARLIPFLISNHEGMIGASDKQLGFPILIDVIGFTESPAQSRPEAPRG